MDDDPDLDLVSEVFAQFLTEDLDDNNEPLVAMKTEFLDDALEALGFTGLERGQRDEIAKALDEQHTGYIEFEKFAQVMLMKLESIKDNKNNKQSSRDPIKQAEIDEAFELFAPGKDTITLQDLKEVSRLVKDNANDQDLRHMLLLSGKLEVNKQEFASIIKQTQAL